MEIEQLRNLLKERYNQFFDDMHIDYQSGMIEGTSKRFTGYPFIGRNYLNARLRILFIPLDVGEDECRKMDTYHSFQDRQDIFVDGDFDFNYHIAGMYATALFILKDSMDYQQAWDALWEQRSFTNKIAVRNASKKLPKDLMSYIAYENRYRFVTRGRETREGGDDRIWINADKERQMLIDEIEIFAPHIIVFQGKEGLYNCAIENLKQRYKVIITGHPSCYQHNMNRIQYIVENIGPQLK